MNAVVASAKESLAHHGRTFSLASRFLPPDRRNDAALLYALCRHIDDLADEAPDPVVARTQLTNLHEQLLGQRPGEPLVQAWLEVASQRNIPLYPLEALIAGVLTDLDEVMLPDDESLDLYAYRVAGTVGLLMCGVLGVDDLEALPLAVDLGIAMQLTNICRDVKEDAERGRVYLPANRLAAAGTSQADVLAGTADPAAIAKVVGDLLAIADTRYARGELGLAFLPWRCRFAIRAAARMYRAIGVRLRRAGADPMAGRTVVPWHGKLMGVFDAAFRPLPLLAAEAAQ